MIKNRLIALTLAVLLVIGGIGLGDKAHSVDEIYAEEIIINDMIQSITVDGVPIDEVPEQPSPRELIYNINLDEGATVYPEFEVILLPEYSTDYELMYADTVEGNVRTVTVLIIDVLTETFEGFVEFNMESLDTDFTNLIESITMNGEELVEFELSRPDEDHVEYTVVLPEGTDLYPDFKVNLYPEYETEYELMYSELRPSEPYRTRVLVERIMDETIIGLVDFYSTVEGSGTIPMEDFEVSHEGVIIDIGDEYSIFTDGVYPENTSNKIIDTSVYETDILRRIDGYTYEALSEGRALIKVKSSDGSNLVKFIDVYVKGESFEYTNEIIIESNRDTISSNGQVVLSAQSVPSNATFNKVYWDVSDPDIVSFEEGEYDEVVGDYINVDNSITMTLLDSTYVGEITVTARTANSGVNLSDVVYADFVLNVQGYETKQVNIVGTSFMVAGETSELSPQIIYSEDLETEPEHTWNSSDDSIASVDSNGIVTSYNPGVVTITLETFDGATATHVIEVAKPSIESVDIKEASVELDEGSSRELIFETSPSGYDYELTWTSSNEGVATVEDGIVRGVSEGTSIISVTSVNGDANDSIEVVVKKPDVLAESVTIDEEDIITIKIGSEYTLDYTVNPEGATDISWYTSDNSIVSVDTNGKIYAYALGSASITLGNANGSISDSINVVVEEGSEDDTDEPADPTDPGDDNDDLLVPYIDLDSYSVELLLEESYTIRGTVKNSTDNNLYYETDDDDIIALSERGVVTGIEPGTATVYVHNGRGLEEEVTVKVIDEYKYIYAKELEIADFEDEVQVGDEFELDYEIRPSSSKDAKVVWKSSDDKIAEVDSYGVITAKRAGRVTIYAEVYDTKAKDSIRITIGEFEEPLEAIEIEKTSVDMEVGQMHVIEYELDPEDTTFDKMTFEIIEGKDVVKVLGNGMIYAQNPGTAQIKVSAEGTETNKIVRFNVLYPEDFWNSKQKIDNVREHKDLIIKFSLTLDEQTVKDNVYISQDETGNTRIEEASIKLSNDRKRVVIETPEEGWETGGTYYVFVRAGLSDSYGNSLGQTLMYEVNVRN